MRLRKLGLPWRDGVSTDMELPGEAAVRLFLPFSYADVAGPDER